MTVACQKEITIHVDPGVTCGEFDVTFVGLVNSAYGTTWDGRITGVWGGVGGLFFENDFFIIRGGVGGTNVITFEDKLAAPGPSNPATTDVNSSPLGTVWTWQSYSAGNPIFDHSIAQFTELCVCGSDTCGLAANTLTCPNAAEFYETWTGDPISSELQRIVLGPVVEWWVGDAAPPALTKGIIVTDNYDLLIANGDGIHTVQFVKDTQNGCPIGNYHFSQVTFGPPPPPPSIPANMFVMQ